MCLFAETFSDWATRSSWPSCGDYFISVNVGDSIVQLCFVEKLKFTLYQAIFTLTAQKTLTNKF